MEKGILGIDPGLGGAAVLLSRDKKIIDKFIMPTVDKQLNLFALYEMLGNLKDRVEIAYLEYVSSRPLQSAPATFKFGRVYGAIEAMLVAHKISYTLVTPKKWTAKILEGIEKTDNPKDRNRIAIMRLFPGIDFRATERCRVSHSGLVDACLIASYGLRVQNGISQGDRKAV